MVTFDEIALRLKRKVPAKAASKLGAVIAASTGENVSAQDKAINMATQADWFGAFIVDSLVPYSQFVGRPVRTELPYNSAGTLLAEWMDGVSSRVVIEHPIGALPPRYVSGERVTLITNEDGTASFTALQLINGTDIAVEYRTAHALVLTDDDPPLVTITLPKGQADQFAEYCAGRMFDAIAEATADNFDPTVAVDGINRTTMTNNYLNAAKKHYERFEQLAGVSMSSGRAVVVYRALPRARRIFANRTIIESA